MDESDMDEDDFGESGNMVIGGSCCSGCGCFDCSEPPWHETPLKILFFIAISYVLGVAIFSLFEWELEFGIHSNASLPENILLPLIISCAGFAAFIIVSVLNDMR